MKRQLTVFCLLVAGSCFPQEPGTLQFWNHYAFLNPATDGLQYRQHAVISGNMDFGNYYTRRMLSAVYSTKLNRISSGIGVHYRHTNQSGYENRAGINYNYQHTFGKIRASAGLGLDYEQRYDEYFGYDAANDSIFVFRKHYTPTTTLNAGVALAYKGLLFGASITALNQPKREHWYDHPDFPNLRYLLFAGYEIRLGDRFHLTPRLLAEIVKPIKYGPSLRELVMNAEVSLDKKYRLGVSYQLEGEEMAATIGWDIREKYRIGYAFAMETGVSPMDHSTHEVVLAFLLK